MNKYILCDLQPHKFVSAFLMPGISYLHNFVYCNNFCASILKYYPSYKLFPNLSLLILPCFLSSFPQLNVFFTSSFWLLRSSHMSLTIYQYQILDICTLLPPTSSGSFMLSLDPFFSMIQIDMQKACLLHLQMT